MYYIIAILLILDKLIGAVQDKNRLLATILSLALAALISFLIFE